MKKLLMLLMLFSASLLSAQTDTVYQKMINDYNTISNQIAEYKLAKGQMEGYMQNKATIINSYGTIDSAKLVNTPDLRERIEKYKKLEEDYKKIEDTIPRLEGKLQSMSEEILLYRKLHGMESK